MCCSTWATARSQQLLFVVLAAGLWCFTAGWHVKSPLFPQPPSQTEVCSTIGESIRPSSFHNPTPSANKHVVQICRSSLSAAVQTVQVSVEPHLSTAWKDPLPAMQWHTHKGFLAFLPGNLVLLFLRLQYILNMFKFRSFVKSLSMPIESLLTTIFFLETKSLPSIPTKRYESEPNLPKPKLLLPNAGQSNCHCLSIEKTPNRQRSGKLTMSSRLAGWSPRLC